MKSEIRTATRRRSLAVTVAALSASTILAMTPTKASAFDIGGMIGTAMAIKMQMDAYRGGYGGGGYRARGRAVSHHDSDSDDHDSSSSRGSSGGERDARDSDSVDRASRPDNRLAMRRQTLGPGSSSGGLAQASERDASADQGPASGRSFDDKPSFNPSR
jgi:hypothetical protein